MSMFEHYDDPKFEAEQFAREAVQAHLDSKEVLVQALKAAFPHFNDEEVTPEAIHSIGREHMNMLVNWIPMPKEIEFEDDDGRKRKLVFERGDASVGIQDCWVAVDV